MHKTVYSFGILTLITHASAMGAVIVSTFGPGDSYSTTFAFGNVAPTQMGYPFLIPSGNDFIFSGAALALSQGIGSTNAVDISLASDASDSPGAILETFHLENALGPVGASNPPVVVTSLLNPLLVAGSQYWLIESPSVLGNGVNWQEGFFLPNPAQRATRNDGGPWNISTIDRFSHPGAFSISGTATSVPEPCSMALLISGLLVFGLGRSTGKRVRSQTVLSAKFESPSLR